MTASEPAAETREQRQNLPPAKIEVRVLHGEKLQRLFAGAKPDIYYVPVRAGDYAKLPRLGDD